MALKESGNPNWDIAYFNMLKVSDNDWQVKDGLTTDPHAFCSLPWTGEAASPLEE